jgi:hypothetical protein
VIDEILTLVMYCGRTCQYPYPFLGPFSPYDAEIIADVMILLGFALVVYGVATPKGLSSPPSNKEVAMSGVGVLKLSRKAHIFLQAVTTITAAYLSAVVAVYAPPMISVPTIALIGGAGSALVTYLSTNGS